MHIDNSKPFSLTQLVWRAQTLLKCPVIAAFRRLKQCFDSTNSAFLSIWTSDQGLEHVQDPSTIDPVNSTTAQRSQSMNSLVFQQILLVLAMVLAQTLLAPNVNF